MIAVINPINMLDLFSKTILVWLFELCFCKLEVPTYIHRPISEAKLIWRRKPCYLGRFEQNSWSFFETK